MSLWLLRVPCTCCISSGLTRARCGITWDGQAIWIYAKCIDGQDHIARRRIEDALGDPGEP